MERNVFKYFDIPKQVRFFDYQDNRWIGGIAYGDRIICGCCGSVFEISEIYDDVPESEILNPIIPFGEWMNIEDAICGDS